MVQTKEQNAAQNGEEKPVFDLRKAFNTSGFREYLVEFAERSGRNLDDDIETNNTEYIEERYEAYTRSEGSKAKLRELFIKEIKGDLGITLDKDAYTDIDSYIDEARRENPREIIDISDSVAEFHRLAAEVKAKEDELETLKAAFEKGIAEKGGMAEIEAKEALMQAQIKSRAEYKDINTQQGMFSKEKKERAIELNKKKKGGFQRALGIRIGLSGHDVISEEITRLSAEIDKTTNEVKPIRELESKMAELNTIKKDAEVRYAAVRKMIFEKADKNQKVQKAAQKKVQDEIKGIIEMTDTAKRTLADVDRQQTLLEKARRASSIDVPVYLDAGELQDFQARIDEIIVLELNEEIELAIESNKAEVSGGLDSLENNLKKFTGRQQLGSKEGAEVKNFIIEVLKNKKDEIKKKGTKADLAKSISLAFIIKNLESQAKKA